VLVASLTGGNVAHVDGGLELNVSGGLVGVEEKLVGLGVPFTEDFDHVVVVTFSPGFKLNVQFDGEAGGNGAEVFVAAAEVLSLGLAELDALHVLGEVAHGHCDFVVLLRFDV
jgi:hypothetical protein